VEAGMAYKEQIYFNGNYHHMSSAQSPAMQRTLF